MGDVVDALRRRVQRTGPMPLLTWYDRGRDERTELSATSFANWVDKACHLFDDLGVGPGDEIAVPVAGERPGHWAGLVAIMAGFQLGAHVVGEPTPDSVIAVVGPAHPWTLHPPGSPVVVACSLHPWGLPVRPPTSAVDFADVLTMPDVHHSYPHLGTDLAWDEVSYADLAAVPPESGRVLVRPRTAVEAVEALAAILLGGGSAVVVHGQDDVADIAAAERARIR